MTKQIALKKYEIEDELGQYDGSGFFLGAYFVYYKNIDFDNHGGLIQSDSLVFHLTSPKEDGEVILLSSIEQFGYVTVECILLTTKQKAFTIIILIIIWVTIE